MPKETKGFAPNDRIIHALFGLGTIVESDPRRTVIEFDEGSVRKFVTAMLQIERAADIPENTKPAPAKKARGGKTAKTSKKKSK